MNAKDMLKKRVRMGQNKYFAINQTQKKYKHFIDQRQ